MPMIIGEIRRYLRDNSTLRVSRSLRDTAYRALQAKEAFVREHQREPDIVELARAMNVPKEEVVFALDAILDPVSLFEPVFHDGADTVCVMDQVGDTRNTDDHWLAAIALREAYVNAPILILGEPPAMAIPLLLAYKIMPAVYTAEFAIRYAEAADAFGVSAPFHMKVNTGMNRIGVRWDEVVEFARQISFHRALDLVGTFTHFATADCPGTIDFERQVKRFSEAVNALRAAGINPGIVHAANSAAAIRYPEVQLDMVRLGISLYGFYPCPEAYPMIDLKPAMSVKARITDVKTLPVGEGVSYGLNYRSPGAVKICTMPIGYADGFRRGLSGRTDVLLAGRRFHQVGNICMDQSMFEVNLRQRNDLDPQIGDTVTIVGEQGEASVTIDQMAETLGTIQHEVAIGFGLRHQAVADKADGLPIDYVDPTEGNFSLTESVAVLDKGEDTNPLAMEMARCIIENGRAELIQTYPNPLYEGETADPANQSDYPSIFDEPLTFELFTAHQELSERAKG